MDAARPPAPLEISALRKLLGDHRGLIRTVAGRGYQFTGELRDQETAVTSPARLTNLPSHLPELIGRETALATVVVYASPLQASRERLKGVPPALIQTAEMDVLRDEGEAYARKPDQAGVDVTSARDNGLIHDYGLLNPS